jgi:hypothetical protein
MDKEQKRFLVNVNQQSGRKVRELSECWLWTGGKFATGYGCYATNAAKAAGCIYAHQYSYHLFKDKTYKPSTAFHCSHLCEDPESSHRLCVNPDHLIIESHADNVARMIRVKGATGAKFTLEQAKEIQKRRLSGEEYKAIADSLSVNRRTVERICCGGPYGLPDLRPIIEKESADAKAALDQRIRDLRKEGKSYRQIKEIVKVSESYICGLLKSVPQET